MIFGSMYSLQMKTLSLFFSAHAEAVINNETASTISRLYMAILLKVGGVAVTAATPMVPITDASTINVDSALMSGVMPRLTDE